jgi:hypothetical protein
LIAPATLLEGCPAGSPNQYLADHPELGREVEALHRLARTGVIPTDAADRQLNTYLPLATQTLLPAPHARWLMLPIADAPHHSLLPDLGFVTHRILARCPLSSSVSALLEQCLPSFRCPPRTPSFRDSQDVLLNLVLALLLGLYPGGTVKRPEFNARARAYSRVHVLLTASPERQTHFCRVYMPVLLVAGMEYVARVMPAYMPPQAQHLTSRDPASTLFFRRVPTLCDEFRQALDAPEASAWPNVRHACAEILEKLARLKKSSAPPQCRPSSSTSVANVRSSLLPAHWNAPLLLGDGSSDEYRLLGKGLGLCGAVLRDIQQDFRVFPLPGNLRQMQLDRLREASATSATRAAYLKTRLLVCTRCGLTCKNLLLARLRLDTQKQRLICSTCCGDNLISIDMIGRMLQHKRQFFYLCPSCVSVRPYNEEQAWGSGACAHASCRNRKNTLKPRWPCKICSDPVALHPVERVDHLTGVLEPFYFCQRHVPPTYLLNECINAKQLSTICS